jgi:AraC-like DNA-binding protein
MSQKQSPQTAVAPMPLEGAIVHRVALVDQITRHEAMSYKSVSLPGHLLHVILAGRVEQTVSGVRQELRRGDAVWYYENEEVQGRILEGPWTFYTVNFFAPTLSPPPFQSRVKAIGRSIIGRMERLLDAWRNTSAPPTARHIRVHALLLEILLELLPDSVQAFRMDSVTQLWWELEAKLRGDLAHPIDMKYLECLARRSPRAIVRACQLAVGKSPMKRVKELRLSYARGLVQLSSRSMSEIAFCIGYGRVQEFSRDYHRQFGITPSADRSHGLRL